jgi:hypothetical protein
LRLAAVRSIFPQANISLSEAGGIVAVFLLIMFAPNGPLSNLYSAGIILSFVFVALLTRNIMAIGATAFCISLVCRFLFSVSIWGDQSWIQWYSVSSLLTGHNIYLGSPLAGMSMAAYMPMGDLFGGVLIGLGIQKYWLVWHVIVCCLLAVPVVVRPGVVSLAVFIATANIWAFYDYTNGGGSLEIAFAVLIAAISFYRAGYVTVSVVCFAFVACLRQPDTLLAPFVLILLWREKDWKNIKLFCCLLLLFGGIYILLDPKGFYLYAIKLFELYHQMYFNEHNGLLQNYSISSIPHLFGVNDLVPWREWSWIYNPILFIGEIGLLVIAWRSKSRDTILTLAVIATLFVYILVRGYSNYSYVLATALPFAALLIPPSTGRTFFSRTWATGIGTLLFSFGAMAFLFFLWGKAESIAGSLHPDPPVTIAETRLLQSGSPAKQIPNLDGSNERHTELLTVAKLEFSFAEPVYLSDMRLAGDHVQIMKIKGVDIPWATEPESWGAMTKGRIEYSTDGTSFTLLREITNNVTYSAYPVSISLPRTAAPIRVVRLSAEKMYLESKHWILGNVEFLGHR